MEHVYEEHASLVDDCFAIGKSSLLDVLSGRTKGWTGEVLINGQTFSNKMIRHLCSYVQQDDALYPTLTVRENITYSARLRYGK